MNWILILWMLDIHGGTSQKIEGFSKKGCEQEALRIMAPQNVNILCICVEKK